MDEFEQQPVFYFHHKDVNGKEFNMRFEAETWTEALSNFVLFLKGSGFILNDDSVGVNSNYHCVDPESAPYITEFLS